MNFRLRFLFLAWTAACLPAPAQEPKFEPPLGSVFPLEKSADGTRVLLSRPLLLNRATVLPPGTQFRTIYMPPQEGDPDIKKNNREALEATFSRKTAEVPSQKDGMSPMARAAYRRAYETVWTDPMQFRAWLQRLDEYQLRFVFTLPDTPEALMQPLESLQGLVMHLEEGKPKVLAVLIDSLAHKSGVKAGWTVLSVNQHKVAGLEDFAQSFQEAYTQSQSDRSPLNLEFQAPDETSPRTVGFTAPRSLSGPGFFDSVTP